MARFMRLLRTVSLPLLAGLLHQPVQAWTKTGHAAIGFVAEAKLKTDNRGTWNKLAAILGTANLYDEDVAGWADTVRATYPDIIHTVRIPIDGSIPAATDPACLAGQPNIICADRAIAIYSDILSIENGDPQQRLVALKFLPILWETFTSHSMVANRVVPKIRSTSKAVSSHQRTRMVPGLIPACTASGTIPS